MKFTLTIAKFVVDINKNYNELTSKNNKTKIRVVNVFLLTVRLNIDYYNLDLTINDSWTPTILCIGNHPSAKSAFSPVISLLLTVCFKAMYGHNRTKSFVAIDEVPTLFIPELPATARKYGISTVACV